MARYKKAFMTDYHRDVLIPQSFDEIFDSVYEECKTAIKHPSIYAKMTVTDRAYSDFFFARCEANESAKKRLALVNSLIYARVCHPRNLTSDSEGEANA